MRVTRQATKVQELDAEMSAAPDCMELVVAGPEATSVVTPPQSLIQQTVLDPHHPHPDTTTLQPITTGPLVDFHQIVDNLPSALNVQSLEVHLTTHQVQAVDAAMEDMKASFEQQGH